MQKPCAVRDLQIGIYFRRFPISLAAGITSSKLNWRRSTGESDGTTSCSALRKSGNWNEPEVAWVYPRYRLFSIQRSLFSFVVAMRIRKFSLGKKSAGERKYDRMNYADDAIFRESNKWNRIAGDAVSCSNLALYRTEFVKYLSIARILIVRIAFHAKLFQNVWTFGVNLYKVNIFRVFRSYFRINNYKIQRRHFSQVACLLVLDSDVSRIKNIFCHLMLRSIPMDLSS